MKKIIGVRWNTKAKKWISNIKIEGRLIHLGSFTTQEDAAAARSIANTKYGIDDKRFQKLGELSQERLLYLMSYDPLSGEFKWLRGKSGIKRDLSVGCDNGCGYLFAKIDGRFYRLHRLAFLYMEGSFPFEEVDHIDHNRSNNVFTNLRKVDRSENSKNRSLHVNNTSGYCGVSKVRETGKWYAYMQVAGRSVNIGTFVDIENAIAARNSANINEGFHKNHGGS